MYVYLSYHGVPETGKRDKYNYLRYLCTCVKNIIIARIMYLPTFIDIYVLTLVQKYGTNCTRPCTRITLFNIFIYIYIYYIMVLHNNCAFYRCILYRCCCNRRRRRHVARAINSTQAFFFPFYIYCWHAITVIL